MGTSAGSVAGARGYPVGMARVEAQTVRVGDSVHVGPHPVVVG